ncbi:mannosyl-oligosaccharide 1-2-alpha-mannosidase IC [Apiospora arundinis]
MVSSAWLLALLSSSSQAYGIRARGPTYEAHPDKAAAVKSAFDRAWSGYYKYAFPNDSLKPIAKSFQNDRNGWGASAIDALSTAIVMEDAVVIGQIVDYIPTINFDKSSNSGDTISLFETTIRYLGGLLSAHDMLSGLPSGKYGINSTQLDAILDQATHLADNLKVGFDTPSGVPINDLLFQPPRTTNTSTNGLATIGTLVLEWTRLSDKTGKTEYAELSQKAESYLLNPKPASGEPWPGLLGTNVDVNNGNFVDSSGGWNGGTDSYYEYLIKMYLYDTKRFASYKDSWVKAADSSIKYLASHPSTRPDMTFLAAYDAKDKLSYVSTHLACFDGGNFILGGLTLDRPDYVQFGIDLAYSCHETYTATVTGIGPEVFAWQDGNASDTSNNPAAPAEQAEFYKQAGFWITNSNYILRPEVIESWYYAYRATGDSKYQDWAWTAFQAINATCSVGVGFSEVTNVNAPAGGSFTDFQDSFWFAEVLKYLYMIQAEEAPWQVSAVHDNQYVFNTEAHPFKVAGTPI